MSEAASITVSVEAKVWYFRVTNHRHRERGDEAEADTMRRWATRWQRRSPDTVTGEPSISAAEVGDDFIRNDFHYRVRLPRIVGGQGYGLPAILMTTAQAIAFDAIDGKYVSRTEVWERFLQSDVRLTAKMVAKR